MTSLLWTLLQKLVKCLQKLVSCLDAIDFSTRSGMEIQGRISKDAIQEILQCSSTGLVDLRGVHGRMLNDQAWCPPSDVRGSPAKRTTKDR